MKKQIFIILAALLIISLGINIYQGVSLHQQEQSRQELIDGLCHETAYLSAYSIASIEDAIELDNRSLVYTVGCVLSQRGQVLRSNGIDPRVNYDHGFGTVGSLLNYDEPYSGWSAIGSVDDETPLSKDEIQFLKKVSKALEKYVRTFMADSDFPLENYQNNDFRENIVKTDIDTLNQAVAAFDSDAEALLALARNTGK